MTIKLSPVHSIKKSRNFRKYLIQMSFKHAPKASLAYHIYTVRLAEHMIGIAFAEKYRI